MISSTLFKSFQKPIPVAPTAAAPNALSSIVPAPIIRSGNSFIWILLYYLILFAILSSF